MRRIIRDAVLLIPVLFAGTLLASTGLTVAQVPTGEATLTGTAYRLVDQTIVDGVVVDETEVPITDGRIAIPELGIDMPLAADGTFQLSDLPVGVDPDNPTEVTVIFTAPGLGNYTVLHLPLYPGPVGPILTPQLIETPRVNDLSYLSRSPADAPPEDAPEEPDGITTLSGQVCAPSNQLLTFPQTIRVWENGPGQDGQVHTVDFKFYVKHVLPSEWVPSWNDQSLPAGAMAVKSYAWWHATHAHKHAPGPACYDVDAKSLPFPNHQVFNPLYEDPRTNAAVDSTWYFFMLGADVVQAFYKSGDVSDACGEWFSGPAPGNDMSQFGSHACAQAGMLWLQILPTYYFPPAVSWSLVNGSLDHDQDGCSTAEEFGPNQVLGGRRTWLSFWDFFDTPDPNNVRDKAIATGDIVRVVDRFGSNDAFGTAPINRYSDPLSPPPPDIYHPAFDRHRPLAGGDRWDKQPANGSVTIIDISSLRDQFGHSCIAAP